MKSATDILGAVIPAAARRIGRCRSGVALLALVWLCGVCGPSGAAPARLPWHVSPAGKLVDAAGDPVIVNGEAVWSLAIALKPQELRDYLDDRQRRGINAIIAAVVERYHSGGPRNAMGDRPFGDVPFRYPREPYFRHLDLVVAEAEKRGIVVFLVPAYLGYGCAAEGWCAQIKQRTLAQMRAWGRFLGHRYRERKNVVWLDGGDADARAFGVLPQVTAIAEGIREADPTHLHTVHCHRYTVGSECYDWRWLQVDTVYGDCNTIAALTRRAHAVAHRPFLMIEGRYEDQGADPTCLRAQFLTPVLGGGVGQMFGTNYVRVFLPEWREHLDSPGMRDLTWMSSLVASLHVQELEPVDGSPLAGQLVSTSGEPAPKDAPVVAAAPDGHRLVAYLPVRQPLRLRSAAGLAWCASWIDMTTRQRAAARLEPVSEAWVRAMPEGAKDSLLIAERCRPATGR